MLLETQKEELTVKETEYRVNAEGKLHIKLFDDKRQLMEEISKRCAQSRCNIANAITFHQTDQSDGRDRDHKIASRKLTEKTAMKPQIPKEKWHRSYSKVTRNIVKQLKSRRKEKKEQLQLKWSEKEEELNSELGKKGVTKTEKQIAKNNLVSDRLKDFAKEDNALTIEEYKLIEVHKEKVHEESGEKINIHALLDDIHEEFEKERLVLRQETNNERIRQGQVLQQQKQKKKESYVHRNISNKGGNGKETPLQAKGF